MTFSCRKTLLKAAAFLLAVVLLCGAGGGHTITTSAEEKSYKKSLVSGKMIAEGYPYNKPVAKSASAAKSYFNDAVFIGDSRTVDLMIYSDLSNSKALAYCDVGLNISTVFTKKFVGYKGDKITAPAALKKNSAKYSKVYLMFGLNELGYGSAEAFINQYKKFVATVRSANKNAVIYVQSVLPVSKQRDTTSDTFFNARIMKYNKLIREMCREQKLFYIDLYNAFLNTEGYLPADAASDGIHFGPTYCGKWLSYLQCHTVKLSG